MTTVLTWHGNTPCSVAFDDIYFNPENGLEETRHVFLHGNQLNERFANERHFTIAELGFGTGLNLLAAWQLFRQSAPSDALLHYVTFEQFPLTADAMLKAISHWRELMPLAETLYPQLQVFGEGIYRLHAPQLIFTLVVGDANDWLPQMEFKADAWFLDGFAPAKNPAMWNETLLHEVAQHTRAGGTAATFTAAGAVKRALAAGGFEVRKVQGFGRKRDMLVAQMAGDHTQQTPPATLRIAGGGIAGCAAAYSLALRGVNVDIYEPASIASGASGNAAGALYPILHKQMSAAMHGYWDALRYSRAIIAQHPVPHALCGMLKLPTNADDEALLPSLPRRLGLPPEAMHWLNEDEASAIAGMPLATGALHLPQSAWVEPPALCRALINHPRIIVHSHALLPDDAPTPTLIASGIAAKEWAPHLPLHINRGQLSIISREHVKHPPRCILSHRGYAIPLEDGCLLTGATYARGDADCTPHPADHAENITTAHHYLPQMLHDDTNAQEGRASLRTVTPDRMPLMGQIAPNRYVSTGHGSRGLLSAMLAGEWLSDALCGTPRPMRRDSAAIWDVRRYDM